jgi:hypothetical protein
MSLEHSRLAHRHALCSALLALGALAAGCPETLTQSCPSGTATVGGFTLDFVSPDAGDLCLVTRLADGGGTDAGTQIVSGPGTTPATLCSSAADGGTIFLAIQGEKLRQSPLDGDGGFSFSAQAPNISGTLCNCPIDINESFSGTLQPKSGGVVQFDGDGGLPPVGGIAASLVELVSATDGGNDGGLDCRCNLPCALRYSVTGKPF